MIAVVAARRQDAEEFAVATGLDPLNVLIVHGARMVRHQRPDAVVFLRGWSKTWPDDEIMEIQMVARMIGRVDQ